MDANKAFWVEFFEMYRAFPCLWKVKCPEYSNRTVKNNAYEILVDKFREIYPDANKQMVLKKINIIRTCYRREAKKIKDSHKSGASGKSLYVPNLWYFDLLTFLVDQDDSECQRIDESFTGEEEFLDEGQPLASSCKKVKREEQHIRQRAQEKLILQHRQEKLIQQQKDRISELIQQQQSKKQQMISKQSINTVPRTITDDETATISTTWGILYRDLEPRQKLYANKAISEVLYQGALGRLHEYSYKAVESQQITTNRVENSLGITIDRISYNDPEYQARDQIANVSDALNYLKPLEEYAVRENHAAMGLISQLEETLRNLAEDTEYSKYD